MEIRSITFPTPLSNINNIDNDNIDVFVELENGMVLTLVVTTPLNILDYMDKNDKGFLEAGPPDIIVKSLTEENIFDAIKAYGKDNGYWLKQYYLTGIGDDGFTIEDLDNRMEKVRLRLMNDF